MCSSHSLSVCRLSLLSPPKCENVKFSSFSATSIFALQDIQLEKEPGIRTSSLSDSGEIKAYAAHYIAAIKCSTEIPNYILITP